MKKKQDWQLHFNEFVEKNMYKKFEWGKWDCCIFSDACIKAITGNSLIPKELHWVDKETALMAITSYGNTLKNSIRLACIKKNLTKINSNYLQKGDLVIIQGDGDAICGIYDGSKTIGPSETGLCAISGNKVIEGWRVN
tara:strand:+ start:226 stop:642 length:417 start_codon:yes stop_codon:yes gene_type:complete